MRFPVNGLLLLGLLVELLKCDPILGLPFRKSVRTASMNSGCSGARAGKLSILGEGQEAVLLCQDTVCDELLAKGDDKRVPLLCRRAVFQHGCRSTEHDKPIRSALSPSLRTLDAADELLVRLALCRSLRDRCEKV